MKNKSVGERRSRGGGGKDASLYSSLWVMFILLFILIAVGVMVAVAVMKYCRGYKEESRKANSIKNHGMFLSSSGRQSFRRCQICRRTMYSV